MRQLTSYFVVLPGRLSILPIAFMLQTLIALTFLIIPVSGFAESLKAELTDFNGKAQTLESVTGKGKWSIVMFWAHDCHVCNKEAHSYVDFHQKHNQTDAEVIGVSLDGKTNKKQAVEFVKRHKLNFTNLIGEPDDVAGIFEDLTGADWVGTPTFLIYNPKGEIRAQQVGAVPVDLIESFIAKETGK